MEDRAQMGNPKRFNGLQVFESGGHLRLHKVLVVGTLLVAAGQPGCAYAACMLPTRHYSSSESEIYRFVKDPRALLTRHPGADFELTREARIYAAIADITLAALMKVVPAASPEQRQAIGQGLGHAANGCLQSDRQTTQKIDEAVRQSNNRDLELGYHSVRGVNGSSDLSRSNNSGMSPSQRGNANLFLSSQLQDLGGKSRSNVGSNGLSLQSPRMPLADPFKSVKELNTE
jgi:hypothetical protein